MRAPHPLPCMLTYADVCDVCCTDEATQAVEPACLIPLHHGAQRLVMVGDQVQPPTYADVCSRMPRHGRRSGTASYVC
jgi:hypothetical protein